MTDISHYDTLPKIIKLLRSGLAWRLSNEIADQLDGIALKLERLEKVDKALRDDRVTVPLSRLLEALEAAEASQRPIVISLAPSDLALAGIRELFTLIQRPRLKSRQPQPAAVEPTK